MISICCADSGRLGRKNRKQKKGSDLGMCHNERKRRRKWLGDVVYMMGARRSSVVSVKGSGELDLRMKPGVII